MEAIMEQLRQLYDEVKYVYKDLKERANELRKDPENKFAASEHHQLVQALADLNARRRGLEEALRGAVAGLGGNIAGAGGGQFLIYESQRDFLMKYRLPTPLKLADTLSTQTMAVGHSPPCRAVRWEGFDGQCRAMIAAMPHYGPVYLLKPSPPRTIMHSELDVQRTLDSILVKPLVAAFMEHGRFFNQKSPFAQLSGLSGLPDDLFVDLSDSQLLVPVEYKTSKVLCAPDGDLAAMYATAADGSTVQQVVGQMYSYLKKVPYGVLITDQQLFCMRREHSTLYISPAIAVTGSVHCPAARNAAGRHSMAVLSAEQAAELSAQQQSDLADGHDADAITAVGALYSIIQLATQWWQQAQMQADPSGVNGGGSGRPGTPNTARRSLPGEMTAEALLSTSLPKPLQGFMSVAPLLPTVVSEGSYASRDVLEGGDPRFTPNPFLGGGRIGTLKGAINGQPAAVKLVDLGKQPEMRVELQREAEIYNRLRALQGDFIPCLLAYGYLDGWQYFLATSLEGPPLSGYEDWPLDDATISKTAARALDEVHKLGVLHGDIALRNLVFSPAGAPDRVLLLDFGCARLVADAADACGKEAAVLLAAERRLLMHELGMDEQQGTLGSGSGGAGGSSNATAPFKNGCAPPAAVAPRLRRGPSAMGSQVQLLAPQHVRGKRGLFRRQLQPGVRGLGRVAC